jgi:excisionase family DNA binding protein
MSRKEPNVIPASESNFAPITLDVKQAAVYLSTTPFQIPSLVYGKELRPFRLGKKYLFRVEDLRAFVDRKAKES